jgi:two-component system, NarL family, response regulator DevR
MNQRGRSLSDTLTASRRGDRRNGGVAGETLPRRMTLVIVDDHEIVRHGLRAALAQETDMEVVADVRTGRDAIRIAQQLRPDVMLLDVRLEDTDGPSVCERVRAVAPDTAVVMLTSYHQDGMVLRSLAAGARGYVVKDVELSELKRMIRAAYRGQCVLDPTVAPHVIAAATSTGTTNQASVKRTLALSDFDLDVVRHLARGLTNKQIGALVHRSPHTVKDHLEKICAALEVRSRTEAVAAALRIGLI